MLPASREHSSCFNDSPALHDEWISSHKTILILPGMKLYRDTMEKNKQPVCCEDQTAGCIVDPASHLRGHDSISRCGIIKHVVFNQKLHNTAFLSLNFKYL